MWDEGARRPETCTERTEVDAAGMSVKVEAPCLGRSDSTPATEGGQPRREARLSGQKSAEGMAGRLDRTEGANTEQGERPQASMTKETRSSMVEQPEAEARGTADGIGEIARSERQTAVRLRGQWVRSRRCSRFSV